MIDVAACMHPPLRVRVRAVRILAPAWTQKVLVDFLMSVMARMGDEDAFRPALRVLLTRRLLGRLVELLRILVFGARGAISGRF